MTIDSIRNGVVIDHIPAGKALEIYHHLHMEKLGCSVAILTNVYSEKLGRKDIIKIDEDIELNWDVIGYLAPACTVNIIREGQSVEKRRIKLATQLTNVIFCRNPRCITTIEQELPHVFKLVDEKKGLYRCIYCESKA
ncbi:MAG: aspartate carbamoyltransferase regulatory subunit [Oscillospiraceae bacterium]|nr:aspartate carbamoyltransferase regulatory subunit [Oscillospiraceae bacterium]